jgi:hypothetical protein
MLKRPRSVTFGHILTILMGLFLILSGILTIIGPQQVVEQYKAFNLDNIRVLIGLGKIISSILFLIPSTFILGALLLVAFWGGAIVAHLSIGDPVIIQTSLLLLVIITIFLRKPRLLRHRRIVHSKAKAKSSSKKSDSSLSLTSHSHI